MTEEEYLHQVERIKTDPRYPPALRDWALEKLREVYEKSVRKNETAPGCEAGGG